ncbi:MAG: S-methyl-5-thioribose-1-phosphate isomerase, partial [Gammaproteobacteria bacterium]|nr:S-methyl-5-thioribose-1-phosphate isomerase [Gammaproteobacteria bacterium]
MATSHDSITPIEWREGGLRLLDQRELPGRECYVDIDTVAAAAAAIESLTVRGAPAIGITAAYAAVLSLQARVAADPTRWQVGFGADLELLQAARPTAVNLAWAIDIMRKVALGEGAHDVVARALATARRLHSEDIQINRAIGAAGARLLQKGDVLLTHCNTGSLATAGYGTALGIVRAAAGRDRLGHVYVDETRPWLQGARLTAWELDKEDIPFTLVVDSVAASLMQAKRIQAVVVGADRVAANGDVANK